MQRLIAALGFALAWMSCAAGVAGAEMTAREVTALMFRAERGRPVNLAGKDLSGLDLAGIDFKGAVLDGANLYGADLTGANLSGAKLRRARLDRATLIGADFSDADLSDASVLRPNNFPTMTGTSSAPPPRFTGARLVNANLNGRFDGVDFRGADLTSAFLGPRDPREEVLITPMMQLRGADFSGASLRGADLALNDIQSAKFTGANLEGANLREARLDGADFRNARMSGANLAGATQAGARFEGVVGAAQAKGLVAVRP